MEKESLKKLLKQTESSTLEFKRKISLSSEKDRIEFAKDVSAFANTRGGHIIFGKEEPQQGGRIVGINKDDFSDEQMQLIIYRRCNPPVGFEAKLERLQSKWFAILSIPESPLKPHEIIQTKNVWIRRGRIVERASAQEILQMRDRAKELKRGEKLGLDLEETEGRAMAFTMFSLLIICYLPARLVTFWILGKGLGLINWLSFEALVATIVLAAIILFVTKAIFGESFNEKMISSVRKVSMSYVVSLMIFVLAIIILNLTIFLYPSSSRFLFQENWQSFLIVCAWSLLVISVTFVLSHFPVTQYLAKLKNPKYKPNPAREAKQLISDLKQKTKIRNKLQISMVLGLLLITALVVPIDLATGLFVPSYHEEGESFSNSYPFVSDRIYLFIYAERVSPSTIRLECRFYRLAQIKYTIYPAKFPLLRTIRIPNPTNVTKGSNEDPGIGSSSSDVSTYNLGYVYVNTSKNADYNFFPQADNLTHIEFEFPEISEPFIANISYWKFLENVNVSVTATEPQYTNLGNNTWLETYTFLVVNNEDVLLTVMALEFDRFLYAVVNATTTKVYSQGQELEWAYFVYQRRRLGELTTIGSGYTLNLTITFQSTDIT